MRVVLCVLSVALVSSLGLSAQDVFLIIHPSNKNLSLSQKDVQKIYLNRKRRWDNGDKITPITLNTGKVHKVFLSQYLHKGERQFSTFWKRLLFTGKGVPPTSFATEDEVVAFVAKTPGAIGYVGVGTILKEVTPVMILKDSS